MFFVWHFTTLAVQHLTKKENKQTKKETRIRQRRNCVWEKERYRKRRK